LEEDMMIIESNLWNLIGTFIVCHNILMVIFLLLLVIKNQGIRNESKNWVYTFNTILPVFVLIYFLSLTKELFTAWYGQNPYEWYAFSNQVAWYGITFFLINIFLALLIAMLFFIKKFRLNFILIIIYLITQNTGLIDNLIVRMSRDYLPSSWSTYYEEPLGDIVLKWSLPFVTIPLTYFFLHKKNKLPYPSVFLK
jgi:hypothetical protein